MNIYILFALIIIMILSAACYWLLDELSVSKERVSFYRDTIRKEAAKKWEP